MSDRIRVAIVEDEKPAARVLAAMISELRPEWEVLMLPGNISGAVEWFSSHEHPDIVFLDIQLSDGNSFIFIERARPQSCIVFTTAYDEYAVRAFTVNSIDYLLKPVRKERLEDAVKRYEKLVLSHSEKTRRDEILEAIRSFDTRDKKYRTRFLVTGVMDSYTLRAEDVAFFHTEEKIVFAVDKNGREHMIDLNLNQLSDQLDPNCFFRANRQVILNIDSVVKIEQHSQNRILVKTAPRMKEPLVVSREKAAAFKLWLDW